MFIITVSSVTVAVVAPEGGRGLKPPSHRTGQAPHQSRLVEQKQNKNYYLKFVFAFLLINWPYKSLNPVEQLKNHRKLPIFDPWTPNRTSFSGTDHAPGR